VPDGLRIDRAPLTASELDECAVVGLRAFYTDPFFVYLAPRAHTRNRGLYLFIRTALKYLGPGGRISTVRNDEGRILAVAGWVSPGGYPQPAMTQLASVPGTLRALYRRPKALVDGMSYLNAIAKAHPKEEHWYLYLLFVDPEAQRQGLGGVLLADRLSDVDQQGLPAYLETQKEDNIPYYRRFGFEHEATLSPVVGGPPIYTMRREAAR